MTYSVNQGPVTVLETGIKVIDLFAPWRRGGFMSIQGWQGVGMLVNLTELCYRIGTNYSATTLFTSSTLSGRAHLGLQQTFDDNKNPDGTSLLPSYEQFIAGRRESAEQRVRAYQNALQRAEQIHLRDRQNVFTCMTDGFGWSSAFEELRLQGTSRELREYPWFERCDPEYGPWNTTLIAVRWPADHFAHPEIEALPKFDSTICLARRYAEIGIYPAIDPVASTSTLLHPSIVGERHVRVAQQARELISQYDIVQRKVLGTAIENLPPEEQQIIARARRLRKFFSQPYYVAAQFTGMPGKSCSREQVVSDVEEILAGEADSLPEAAFYFVGTLADAREKASKS